MSTTELQESPTPSTWHLAVRLAALDGDDEHQRSEPDSGPEEPEESTSSRAQANAVLRRVVGERIADARKLNGWDQCVFSARLGAANSTQASLWEQGKRLPPLHVLIEAARILGVSVDYLLGESEEFERDPKLAARAAAFRRVERLLKFNTEAVAECLLNACSSSGADEIRVARFASRARLLCDAVSRFQHLNSDAFDDLRGGATLVHAARELGEALRHIDRFLQRSAHDRAAALARARALTEQRARRNSSELQPTT